MSDPLAARFLSHPPHCEPAARPSTGRRAAESRSPLARSSPALQSSPRPRSTGICAAPATLHQRSSATAQVDPSHPQNLTEARAFAERTLRMVLEVMDRRRKPEHLRPVLTSGLVDTVAALSRADLPARRLGAAALSRVHVSMVDPTSAEVFATYARGQRVFAVAARAERRTAGWRCVALRVI